MHSQILDLTQHASQRCRGAGYHNQLSSLESNGFCVPAMGKQQMQDLPIILHVLTAAFTYRSRAMSVLICTSDYWGNELTV